MLYYDFDIFIDEGEHGEGECDVQLDVWEEHINLITQFLFEKHFGIPYRELGWWLEPGAKEFVKDIEDKWLHNQLDFSSYREEYKDWLYDRFLPDALSEIDRDDILDLYFDFDDDDDDDDDYDEDEARQDAEIVVTFNFEEVGWL